jgi:hypothetical protein
MFMTSLFDVIKTSNLDVYDVDINTSNLDLMTSIFDVINTSNLDVHDVDIRRHKHEQL